MAVTIPHFGSPFTLTKSGAGVVEQNSPEEVLSCVRNVILCPVGFRAENSEFGSPQEQFGDVPLSTDGLTQAIRQWEPRASVAITESVIANEQERRLVVDVITTQAQKG